MTMATYKPDYTKYAGQIYQCDFCTDYTKYNVIQRIAADWMFDKKCLENIKNRERKVR